MIFQASQAEAKFASKTYDVVVNDDSSSGVMAAYAARMQGASVALLGPRGAHPGGIMTQAAVCATDLWFKTTLRGLACQWFQEMAAKKLRTMDSASFPPLLRPLTTPDYARTTGATWDAIAIAYDDRLRYWMPSEAEVLFLEWITRSGVDYFPGVYQPEKTDVVMASGDRIKAIRTNVGDVFGKAFVEASMEADLLAGSGVPYTWGREAQAQYGESAAGVYKLEETTWASVNMRDANGAPLYPLIEGDGSALGAAHPSVMGYNLRMVIGETARVATVPIWKPDNYDASKFELLIRLTEAYNWTLPNVTVLYNLRNGYHNTNNGAHPAEFDLANRSWGWPDGTRSQREAIYREHLHYNVGALWTLQNDPRVPAALRADANRYGFAPSEWAWSRNVPPMPYVREGRRMVSDAVLSQRNIRLEPNQSDLVVRVGYPADCHPPRQYLKAGTSNVVVRDGGMYDEIDNFTGQTLSNDFQIGLKHIRPPANSVKNLVVTVPVSCSHVVWAPLRMEPTFMMLGEAGGTLAALAALGGLNVQDVGYSAGVKPRLQRTGLLA